MAEDGDTPHRGLEAYRVTSASRGNAVSGATTALREAILDGVVPGGTWLREESLSKALGVSRTPVREALARLEDEGLIQREPGAGARVTTVSIDDMSVIYHVRGSLESLAARYAAARITPEGLAVFEALQGEMRDAAAGGDSAAFSRANVLFHRQLSVAAANAYLARLLIPVEVGLRRFGARSLTAERMNAVLTEHDALLQAFAKQDPDAAAEAATAHADRARASTLERMISELR